VVFRLWANKPETVAHGNALSVRRALVDGRPATLAFDAAGAPKSVQGSLLRLPLSPCRQPGEMVRVDLDFALRLGRHTPERIGRGNGLAWMASGFPMLAWQRGRGWATNPVVDQSGEMTTSETFRLRRLDVVVPADLHVLGTGRALGRTPGKQPGTVVESFAAPAVRDVAVTAGAIDLVERRVDGTVVHVGGPANGTGTSLRTWAEESARALRELSSYLGPYPYSDLWISVIPDCPTGIEFPGAIQYTDLPPQSPFLEPLVSHETAHMWFYALVGNNQGRDPWLDEAFASLAQAVVDGYQLPAPPIPAQVRAKVGRPMTWWARPSVRRYYSEGVYAQGSAMLFEARETLGARQFDTLLRRYVADNAHTVATPDDVRRAFAGQPSAIDVLRSYGALR
ncbi:MAG: M1 family aminopeptidase, partial [Nocardioidaceae bacterium]